MRPATPERREQNSGPITPFDLPEIRSMRQTNHGSPIQISHPLDEAREYRQASIRLVRAGHLKQNVARRFAQSCAATPSWMHRAIKQTFRAKAKQYLGASKRAVTWLLCLGIFLQLLAGFAALGSTKSLPRVSKSNPIKETTNSRESANSSSARQGLGAYLDRLMDFLSRNSGESAVVSIPDAAISRKVPTLVNGRV